MKNILCIIILIFSYANIAKSQTLEEILNANAGSYLPSTELDKFTGNWLWTSGQDTFKIFFKKIKVASPINSVFVDCIFGYHEYKKNGQLIESSMNFLGEIGITHSSLRAGCYWENSLAFIYEDLTKNKRGRASIKFTAGKFDEGLWTIIPNEMIADSNPPSVWTVPKNIVLKKLQ